MKTVNCGGTKLWAGIPPELLHIILVLLDQEDIYRLRLSCHTLKDSCLPIFRRFLVRRRVYQSNHSLDSFRELAEHAELGCAVRQVQFCVATVDWKAYDDPGTTSDATVAPFNGCLPSLELATVETTKSPSLGGLSSRQSHPRNLYDDGCDLKNLEIAFRCLKQLDSLELETFVITQPGNQPKPGCGDHDWHRVSDLTAAVLSTMTSASLLVKELILFYDQRSCSIPLAGMSRLLGKLEKQDFVFGPGAGIVSLKVSISNGRDGTLSDLDDLAAPARLFNLTPNLCSVAIHFFYARKDIFGSALWDPAHTQIFDKITEAAELQELRDLSIGGLPVRSKTIESFISRHSSLTRLVLESIRLDELGSWPNVFRKIESIRNLRELTLSALWDGSKYPMHLGNETWRPGVRDPTNPESYPFPGWIALVHRRTFKEADILQGLRFDEAPAGMPMGSQDLYQLHYRLTTRYGAGLSMYS